ncbi:MAG TPA: glycosyltransferase [Bryobacteraceae bacterium]|nr:glycosyltransferase [Bryobacteraceae bacterium]
MRVGLCSPLPPARTGVADYAAALLAALRKHGQVEVAPRRADVFLYQIGNNQIHREIYQRALAEPGVVVLHDAVLQHFFLGWLDEAEYAREFVYNYGEWHRGLAADLWRNRASSALGHRYYQFPMLRRIAEVSRAVVVHNPAAARMVREHAPGARVVEIPHLFAQPAQPSAAEALAFRRRWGIPEAAFVFGVFGYLRESKRLPEVLDAFAALRRARPDTALVVAGEFVSADLRRAAEPMLRQPGVVRIPHLPERDFWRAAAAVDACVNLRYPGAGETSGIGVRLMGIGKPVLLTAGEETARYGEAACCRIDAGPGERASLWHHMVLLTSVVDAAREIGLRGADHVAQHHAPERISRQFWKLLCECGG